MCIGYLRILRLRKTVVGATPLCAVFIRHITEKPETLLERIILLGSRIGDTILDPFMGSGTTGVVAKKLARNFIAIEIDDNYFSIAKNRINKMAIEMSLI